MAYALLYPDFKKTTITDARILLNQGFNKKGRVHMKHLRTIIIGGIVAGALIVPGISAAADTKAGNHDFRRNDKWGHYERRDSYHRPGSSYNRRYDNHNYKRDVHHDNRGHHNKPEIGQDFKDVRNARNEVKSDRKELRGDYQELRKDRGRNGASRGTRRDSR